MAAPRLADAPISSSRHGDVIMHRGLASATDVLTLIGDARDLAAQKTGIELERDVKVGRAER